MTEKQLMRIREKEEKERLKLEEELKRTEALSVYERRFVCSQPALSRQSGSGWDAGKAG